MRVSAPLNLLAFSAGLLRSCVGSSGGSILPCLTGHGHCICGLGPTPLRKLSCLPGFRLEQFATESPTETDSLTQLLQLASCSSCCWPHAAAVAGPHKADAAGLSCQTRVSIHWPLSGHIPKIRLEYVQLGGSLRTLATVSTSVRQKLFPGLSQRARMLLH